MMMKYDTLGKEARKTIIIRFLEIVKGRPRFVGVLAWNMQPLCLRFAQRLTGKSSVLAQHFGSRVTSRLRTPFPSPLCWAAAKGEDFSSSHVSQALTANGNVVPASGDT
jgi:hypothetical protein